MKAIDENHIELRAGLMDRTEICIARRFVIGRTAIQRMAFSSIGIEEELGIDRNLRRRFDSIKSKTGLYADFKITGLGIQSDKVADNFFTLHNGTPSTYFV